MPLNEFMEDGLTVGFNKRVTSTTFIGQVWFHVIVEYPVRLAGFQNPTIPPGTILTQRVLDSEIRVEENQAFFRPDPRFQATFFNTLEEASVEMALCRVILKCDFLLDNDGRSVDGDFLGGTLPSGDGVPGGDFESWFVLRRG